MNELISKKELLEKYAISYGTLYRWKRIGLIPEEWFIKKSTFTGQETFFNRELICPRVEEIIAKMNGTSLEEIAKELGKKSDEKVKLIVATKYGDKVFDLSDVIDIRIISGTDETSVMLAIKEAVK